MDRLLHVLCGARDDDGERMNAACAAHQGAPKHA